MKKQSLIKGSLILGIAGMVTRFLGLFFRWPLIMLIGDEGVGYYQMSYPLYMFFIAMASGVPIAISKLISEKNALDDIEGSFEVVKEALLLMVLLGTGTSFVLFFFSSSIIDILQWDYKSYYSLIGISLAPMIISVMTVFRGFFQGLQNMTYSAISQVLEQIGRVVFGVGLAILLLKYGIEYSAGGAAFGATAGGIIAGVYLMIKYKKVKKEYKIYKVRWNAEVLNKILVISIPISLGATVGTIMGLIDSILVPKKLVEAGISIKEATILYAQLTGKAAVIVNIPLTLSMALCVSIIPIIAEVFLLKKRKELERKINTTFKISMIIAMPCMFGLFFMSNQIMNLIFPGRAQGAEILKYLALSIPFIIITQITTSILQGIGKYIIPVLNLLIGCIVKIVLTMILVSNSNINIYGAVIATISAYTAVAILNILSMKIKLKIQFKFFENVIKPIYASIAMIIFTVIIYKLLYMNTCSNGLSTVLSVFAGAIIYGISVLILRILKSDEIMSKVKKIK